MQKEYIFYQTDESFDYNGPFGTEIYKEKANHGFSLKFDIEENPILTSIEGFGDFDEASDFKDDAKGFLNWLEIQEGYIDTESDFCVEISEIEELKEKIKEMNLCKMQ